ncbi:MAG: prolipoprotein diacylglyceryl transferase [Caldilineaceae bacterium]
MNPVIFDFGPFALSWYGVFLVSGALIVVWLAARYASNAGERTGHLSALLAWALIGGVIGARLDYVFTTSLSGIGWAYYRAYPLEIINIWQGGFHGLGFYGALAGGLVATVLYCWRHHLDILLYLDFIAPNLLLGQAIGRMGNYVNQELYGTATSLPWAFHIDPNYPCQVPPALPPTIQLCGTSGLTAESRVWYAEHGFQPTFAYAAAWDFIMFYVLAILIERSGHRLRKGDGLWLYCIVYPLGRFWLGFFWPQPWTWIGLGPTQWVSLGLLGLSMTIMIMRHWHWSWYAQPAESLAVLQG